MGFAPPSSLTLCYSSELQSSKTLSLIRSFLPLIFLAFTSLSPSTRSRSSVGSRRRSDLLESSLTLKRRRTSQSSSSGLRRKMLSLLSGEFGFLGEGGSRRREGPPRSTAFSCSARKANLSPFVSWIFSGGGHVAGGVSVARFLLPLIPLLGWVFALDSKLTSYFALLPFFPGQQYRRWSCNRSLEIHQLCFRRRSQKDRNRNPRWDSSCLSSPPTSSPVSCPRSRSGSRYAFIFSSSLLSSSSFSFNRFSDRTTCRNDSLPFAGSNSKRRRNPRIPHSSRRNSIHLARSNLQWCC